MTVELAHPPAKVWTALTTAEGLAAWFGDEAAIGLRPGGAARMSWTEEGLAVKMRVERVEEPNVFAFTWPVYGLPDDDPRRTYVHFALEPSGAGTRLTVVESGFAQLPEDLYRRPGWLRPNRGSGAGSATGCARPRCGWRSSSWPRWPATGTAGSAR